MRKTNLEAWICSVEGCDILTREILEDIQLDRLNALLRREKERQGFYRNLPGRLESLDELLHLPFTTSQMLAEHGSEMNLVPGSRISRVVTETTSGTTGIAKRIYYTEQDQAHTVGFFAAGLSELVFPGDTVMIMMPLSASGGLSDLIARAIKKLGAVPLKTGMDKSFEELARELEKYKPVGYVGMSVPLLGLIRYCAAEGIALPLKRVLVSGDACPGGVVAEIEERIGSKLFPHFGMREMGLGGAVTCQAHDGMHIRENHVIAEIIGSDGCPVPDGEMGELVITTIGMEAIPMIRYRTGDLAYFVPGQCACKGVTKRLGNVTRMATGVSMAQLDEKLFRASGHLIDYAVSVSGNHLKLDVRTDGTSCRETLLKASRELYPEYQIEYAERACRREDKAMYPAKRTVR